MPRSPLLLAVLLAFLPRMGCAQGPSTPSAAAAPPVASVPVPTTIPIPVPVTSPAGPSAGVGADAPATTGGPATPPPVPNPAAKPAAPTTQAPAASVPHPIPVRRVPADQVIAVLGQTVTGPDGKPVGRLIDVLVDQAGKPQAAVIDFGGFMGVGSRKIAVHWDTLHFHPGNTAHPVVLDLLPEELRQAPRYKGADRPAPVLVEPHPKPAAPAGAPATGTPPAGTPASQPPAAAPSAAPSPAPASPAPQPPAPETPASQPPASRPPAPIPAHAAGKAAAPG